MKTIIDQLNWRYATKKFDADKRISHSDLEILKQAIQLSPSSYGLQPYKVLIIEDKAIRKQLTPVSWGQTQIEDASHLMVIANRTNFDDQLIDGYLSTVSEVRNLKLEQLKGYSDFMKTKLLPLSNETKNNWTARQAYIALGNLLTAAAVLNIDACPIEGFEPEAYNDILDLNSKNLNAVLVIPIGYRHSEDETQHYPKVRRPQSELFETI
ncbi:MAG: NAD(P)H-dependent oxidoreductase [Bacteroidetes bacterium MedPE-SWsnd-G2]|nr:MAG: NAD(P)H-dependent oxidoreductase [Bacteroidetes bacterium MedPE-SWsnd-G2]